MSRTDDIAVGIDAMAFCGPECFVDMVELAQARDIDPAKYTVGLGQLKMAVPTPCEDTVTMAAVAAQNALINFNIDPDDIGTVIVGTETGVDHSKPVAVYVHELLGLSPACRTFDAKHACFGATAGLTTSLDWILSGRARGRKALVIASDIARYARGSAGEPTQGAGAVAMVVSENPRLLRIWPDSIGHYTEQVMDFWRPLYSSYAFTDGHYSIECYLGALEGALIDARECAGGCARLLTQRMAACFYHVPFVKMAKKAHQRHLEIEHARRLEDCDAKAAFEKQVLPWLSINAVVGNIYTGSLFLALIDFLRQSDGSLAGRDVSMFSYGSGCTASYCTGQIQPGAEQYSAALCPQADIDRRHQLSIGEYEELMSYGEMHANDTITPDPGTWGLTGDIFYRGTIDHVRQYKGA